MGSHKKTRLHKKQPGEPLPLQSLVIALFLSLHYFTAAIDINFHCNRIAFITDIAAVSYFGFQLLRYAYLCIAATGNSNISGRCGKAEAFKTAAAETLQGKAISGSFFNCYVPAVLLRRVTHSNFQI